MKTKLFTLLMLFLYALSNAWGQDRSVYGKVTSAADNEPIIGASIVIKGTTVGTVSDLDGKFSITAKPDAILAVSYLGYSSLEVPVRNQTEISIQMTDAEHVLDNVVVVGYGKQKKADLTSSIATLNPEEVLKAPGGITEALQGSTAGVNVSGGKIRIRGTSSITGNTDPLWVVDGLIDGTIPNEDEIETIQVLKDAASCAIYGVRGANGVIVVTTKKGKEGTPQINFNTYVGTGSVAKKINMMNAYDYGIYVNELYYNSSDAASIANGTWNKIVPTNNSNPSNPLADTEWRDQYFSSSVYQKYDLSISGASKFANYRLGATYKKDENDIKTNNNNEKNIYANVEGTKGRLTYGGRVQASIYKSKIYRGASLMNMLMLPSNLPVYNEDGSFYKTGVNELDGNDLSNQAWFLHNQRQHNSNTKALGSIFGEVKLFDWLKYRLSYTYSTYRNNDAELIPQYDLGASRQNYNYQSTSKGGNNHKVLEHLLTFDKTFGNHSLGGVAGIVSETFEAWSTTNTGQSNEHSDFGPESNFPNAVTVSSSWSNLAYYSYLARIMYSYNSKYMLTANFRADESSKFAKGKRWGYFPSFSAGWRISEESWFKEPTSKWLDNLKLRATLGWIGSAGAVGYYDYQSVVETNNRYYTFGPNQSSGNAADSNAAAPLPETFADKSLTWETTRDAGFGFDLDALSNKLTVTFDYYNRKVTDMLLNVQLPKSAGTPNSVWMNVGSMTNWGIELTTTYRDKISDDFNFSVTPIFSLYRNKVTSLGDNESLAGGNINTGANVTRTVTGRSVAQFWGYKTDGLFKTDEEAANYVNDKGERLQAAAKAGDLKYVDINGDGSISDADKTFIGSSTPDYSLGLNLSFDYKGFDFSMLFQGDFGYDIYNNWKSTLLGGFAAKNQMTDMKNRFRANDVTFTTAGGEKITLPVNTNTSVPRAVLNDPNNNHQNASDYFIENGSYFRCNRITLGYTFQKNLLKKLSVDKLRVYTGVKNPFTITDYSMFDPQVPNGGSTLNRGVDGTVYYSSDTYWSQREFFAGLQLTF